MAEEPVFEELKIDTKYEICNEYPYNIRRKGSNRLLKEWIENTGYPRIRIGNKNYCKHRVVASQWIPNPNNLPCVDHKNRNKLDYHVTNLRWVSESDNNRNKTSSMGITYNYVDELSENAFEVSEYGMHEFQFLYYDPESGKFYFYTGVNYREMHYCKCKTGALYVNVIDIENKHTLIYLNAFKKQHDMV